MHESIGRSLNGTAERARAGSRIRHHATSTDNRMCLNTGPSSQSATTFIHRRQYDAIKDEFTRARAQQQRRAHQSAQDITTTRLLSGPSDHSHGGLYYSIWRDSSVSTRVATVRLEADYSVVNACPLFIHRLIHA